MDKSRTILSVVLILLLPFVSIAAKAPKGMKLVSSNNCGLDGAQPDFVRGESWALTEKELEGIRIIDERTRHMNHDERSIVYTFKELHPKARFVLRVIFLNVTHERKVSVSVGNAVLDPSIELPMNQLYLRDFKLSSRHLKDGKLTVRISKRGGHSAMVSAIELWADRSDKFGLGQRIETATGGHTRLAWVRRTGENDGGRIMGYDSRASKEHVIVPGPVSVSDLMITPDGAQLIYSDSKAKKSYIVGWDGKKKPKVLGEGKFGRAIAVRRDEKDVDWVYYAQERWKKDGDLSVIRNRLDGKGPFGAVWSKTQVGKRFGLSSDASRCGGDTEDGKAVFVGNLRTRQSKKSAAGISGGLAPDNSYRYMHLTDDGTGVRLFGPNFAKPQDLSIRISALGKGAVLRGVSWGANGKTAVLSGPAEHSDLYMGRFNNDFTKLSKWIRLTFKDDQIDGMPVMWISEEKDDLDIGMAESKEEPPAAETVFAWTGSRSFVPNKSGEAISDFSLTPHGQSFLGSNDDMVIYRGGFSGKNALAYATQKIDRSKSMTLSMYIEPSSMPKTASEIMSVFGPKGTTLALLQAGREYLLKEDESTYRVLKVRKPEQPVFLTLVFRGLQLRIYVNGKAHRKLNLKRLVKLNATDIRFGKIYGGAPFWKGKLSSITVNSAALRNDAIAALYESHTRILKKRQTLKRFKVKATLLEKSQPLDAESRNISRGLSVYEYKVERVMEGKLKDKRIRVYHWTLMDHKPTEAAERKQHETYFLTLEYYKQHPELNGIDSSNTLRDNFEIMHFYDLLVP